VIIFSAKGYRKEGEHELTAKKQEYYFPDFVYFEFVESSVRNHRNKLFISIVRNSDIIK